MYYTIAVIEISIQPRVLNIRQL